MIELRINGRGGQGAKTAVEILAEAANYENKYFLAYPEFGPERAGTPINAYFKLDNKKIRSREPILNPDIILVFDKTLKDYDKGLKNNGIMIINSSNESKYHFVDANSISKEITGKLIPNIVMLGALIKVTKILKKESVETAIKNFFDEKTVESFRKGYEEVR